MRVVCMGFGVDTDNVRTLEHSASAGADGTCGASGALAVTTRDEGN